MTVPGKRTTTKTTNAISEESAIDLEVQIRCRAYELYERRGREAGHEVEDWLQAEAELTSERIMSSAGEAVKKNPEPTVTSTGKTKAKQIKKSRSPAPYHFHCGGTSYLLDAAVAERVGGHPRGFSSPLEAGTDITHGLADAVTSPAPLVGSVLDQGPIAPLSAPR